MGSSHEALNKWIVCTYESGRIAPSLEWVGWTSPNDIPSRIPFSYSKFLVQADPNYQSEPWNRKGADRLEKHARVSFNSIESLYLRLKSPQLNRSLWVPLLGILFRSRGRKFLMGLITTAHFDVPVKGSKIYSICFSINIARVLLSTSLHVWPAIADTCLAI